MQHLTLVAGVGLERKSDTMWASQIIQPEIDWTELIPSWDVENTSLGGSIEVFVETVGDRFTFGQWGLTRRSSVNDQKRPAGTLFTDTLVANQPGKPVQFFVQLRPSALGDLPTLNWLKVSLSAGLPTPSVWDGKPIAPHAVPIRSQGDYPGGGVLCSPTSVSMVLSYWAKELDQPILDSDVPEVQNCVHDPAWGGTGNWSFNAAFAATKPGLTAQVARLRDTAELDSWIRAGVPVVTSVSYDLLKGKEARGENDGHLVVVVGVNAQGDYIFNDPGKRPNRLEYPRTSFLRAWASSRNTVYLIYPTKWSVPDLP